MSTWWVTLFCMKLNVSSLASRNLGMFKAIEANIEGSKYERTRDLELYETSAMIGWR